MGGHSHWKGIKEKKGAADAKRGKLFAKLLRAIEVSARQGDPNPENNPTLFDAIQRAKDASMPKDNIERAIKRASGDLAGEHWERIFYEGYGRAVIPVYSLMIATAPLSTGQLAAVGLERRPTFGDERHLIVLAELLDQPLQPPLD